jgi:hypothetical protein
MNIAKVISMIGVLAMTVALANGFLNGDIAAEGAWLLAHPWGIVSLVDLYVGFALFSVWIVYREASRATAAIWVVLLLVLGFWLAALYMFRALNASGGNWHTFWLGARTR